ncbi:helix-turn-helix transcriptional regulator [Rhodococcus daqingensis]|uniref:Helix-turn-helix transcriptional regulator n=1 Tax=Rhodococcus daqingensis TaxID=2479363 RepID=A0ABW2RW74_9NOCA
MNPSTWQATLYDVVDAFDGIAGSLVLTSSADRHITLGVGLGTKTVDSYNNHYRDLDPIARIIEQSSPGTVGCVFDSVPPADLSNSEFFIDWARPSGLGDGLFARFSARNDGPCWFICIDPLEQNRRFGTPWRLKLMHQLIPHLAAAARIERTLSDQRANLRLTTDILEHLDHGALLVDAHGRVQHMNTAAHAILQRSDGLSITSNGELSAGTAGNRMTLCGLIGRVCGHDTPVGAAGSMLIARRSGQRHYVLHGLPIRRDESSSRGPRLALLTIVDPDETSQKPPAEIWRLLYGLTPRESVIAQNVLRGEGLQTVADSLAITLSTVRVHLQHVFEKTNTRRQAELTRLLTATGPIFTPATRDCRVIDPSRAPSEGSRLTNPDQ